MRKSQSSARGYIRGSHTKDDYDYQAFMREGVDAFVDKETGRSVIPLVPVTLKEVPGLYTEGIAVYPSDVAPLGKPFRIMHGMLNYSNGVYMHPTDYYWFKHADDPWRAHNLSQGWMYRRIDKMAEEAFAKLDAIDEANERAQSWDRITTSIQIAAQNLADLGKTADETQKILELVFFDTSPTLLNVFISKVYALRNYSNFRFFQWVAPPTFWERVKDWFRR